MVVGGTMTMADVISLDLSQEWTRRDGAAA
jgi:hypothetical protein